MEREGREEMACVRKSIAQLNKEEERRKFGVEVHEVKVRKLIII